MTVETHKDAGKLTVVLTGRVDTSTAPRFDAAVKNNIAGVTELIIDLDKLEYVSSAGLRVFLSLQKTMNKQGSMEVINVHESIMEIFEVTGFSDIMTIKTV